MNNTAQVLVGVRQQGGALKPAFTIVWEKSRGLAYSDFKDGYDLSDVQRSTLTRHFGSSHKALSGGRDADGTQYTTRENYEPGTAEHFRVASYDLPAPWKRINGT